MQFAYLDVLVDDLPVGGVDEAHLHAGRANVDAHDVGTHLLLNRGLKQYSGFLVEMVQHSQITHIRCRAVSSAHLEAAAPR